MCARGIVASGRRFNRNFRFAFRPRTNIPPFASARELFCIGLRPKTPGVPGWAVAGTKSHALPHFAAISGTLLRHPPNVLIGSASLPSLPGSDPARIAFGIRAIMRAAHSAGPSLSRPQATHARGPLRGSKRRRRYESNARKFCTSSTYTVQSDRFGARLHLVDEVPHGQRMILRGAEHQRLVFLVDRKRSVFPSGRVGSRPEVGR